MAHWLIRLTPTRLEMVTQGPTDRERAILAEHFAHLQATCNGGRVLLFGRTANSDADTIGLCIVRAETEADARAFMETDPAARHGIMAARLFPYRVAGFNADAAREEPR